MSKQHSRNHKGQFNVQSLPKQLQHININAAGIDIGSEQHMVAVPEERDRGIGARVWSLYRRSGGDCRLAGAMRREYCGYGIDRGLLDSVVRVVPLFPGNSTTFSYLNYWSGFWGSLWFFLSFNVDSCRVWVKSTQCLF